MKAIILTAAALFAAAPAAADDLCQDMEGFVADVMDTRLSGQSMQATLELFDNAHLRELVRGVYIDVPRDSLTGSGRADVLTTIRAGCEARWEK